MAFEKKPFNNALFDVDPGEFFKDFGRQIFEQTPLKRDIKTDIIEFEDKYTVVAELPGFTKESITLQYENQVLTIAADQVIVNEADKGTVIHKERNTHNLRRQFSFEHIDKTKIAATFTNCLLYVTLPKKVDTVDDASTIEIN